MDCYDKLTILADAAKYDVACTSSDSRRTPRRGEVGCTLPAGCCHSFSADGRCITLLKVLLSNACSYDCAYCVNRRSARCSRATFGPRELAALTLDFYKRNYIEGLFLSSAVLKDADNTAERMIACLRILRGELHFRGYVHTKVIPGTSPELIDVIGHLSDRLSVNLELPSARSLTALCPDKDKGQIVRPMEQIFRERTAEEQLLAQAPKRRKGLPLETRRIPTCSHWPQARPACPHQRYAQSPSAPLSAREPSLGGGARATRSAATRAWQLQDAASRRQDNRLSS